MSQDGFKNRYLSVSRLRRFERCPLARPVASQVTYPVASTLRVFAEMASVSEAALHDELLVIDKAQVDALVKRLRKSMPRAKHRLLQTTLDAVAEKQFSARLFAQEVR